MIFISQGEINIETMTNVACIVDGQQRCDAITSFVDGKFSVDGQYFHELSEEQKTKFFKYEIPVCELDILNTDEKVLDIFKRINRTSNSLTNIEKTASEYGSSYFMLVAKLLSSQLVMPDQDALSDDITIDPNIPEDFISWAQGVKYTSLSELMSLNSIFSARDIARKVNLQYVLNLMCTFQDGFYNRNDNIENNLSLYLDEFDGKDILLDNFEKVAEFYLSLELSEKSIWFNKANFFTLFIVLSNQLSEKQKLPSINKTSSFLSDFIPSEEYKLAAKEAVNNVKERKLRNEYMLNHIASLY